MEDLSHFPSRYRVAREHILDEIQRYEDDLAEYRQRTKEKVRALNERLNALTAITTLPPEILMDILEKNAETLCQNQIDYVHVNYIHGRSLLATCSQERLKVTHVCRYWREVALHNPQFWNHIFVHNHQECMQTMLDRSNKVPLKISSYIDGPTSECTLFTMELLRSRLVSAIDLHVYDVDALVTAYRQCCSSQLPQSIRLQFHGPYHPEIGTPPLFVSDHVPNLTHMEFGRITISSCELITRPTLRSLILDGLLNHELSALIPSLDSFLYALKAMPSLEQLTLFTVFRPFEGYLVDQVSNVVELPNLRYINIRDSFTNIIRMLTKIANPSGIPYIRFCVDGTRDGIFPPRSCFLSRSLEQLLWLIQQRRCSQHSIRSLRLDIEGFNTLPRFRGWAGTGASSIEPSSSCDNLGDPSLDLQFYFRSGSFGDYANSIKEHLLAMTQSILETMQVADVQTLHMNRSTFSEGYCWPQFRFARGLCEIIALKMVNLHSIRVDVWSDACKEISTLLQETRVEPNSDPPKLMEIQLNFPSLRTIMFKEINFEPKVYFEDIDGDDNEDSDASGDSTQHILDNTTFLDPLLTSLRYRRHSGNPDLRELIFYHCCNINQSEVHGLVSCVDTLHYHERGRDSEVITWRNGIPEGRSSGESKL